MKSFGFLLFLVKIAAGTPDPMVRDDSHLDELFVHHGEGVSDFGIFLLAAVLDTYLESQARTISGPFRLG